MLQMEVLQESLLAQQQQLQSQAAEEQRRLQQQVSAALCSADVTSHTHARTHRHLLPM